MTPSPARAAPPETIGLNKRKQNLIMTQPTVPPKSVRSSSARTAWTDSPPSAPRTVREAVSDIMFECYPVIGLLVLGLALLRIILR